MTKIVNVKSGKPYDVYCGRENKTYNLPQSKWANPFVIGKDGDRKEVIEKYELWLNSQPNLLEVIRKDLKEKTLGCWCNVPEENCHCEILYTQANNRYIQNWFSNMRRFSGGSLNYQGIEFETVENFYQAMKLPKQSLGLRKLIASMSPWEAKKEIRDKERFPWDESWNREKALKVMRYALEFKFRKGTDWYRKLMITKCLGLELVEWNNWSDLWWGKDIKTRNGENHLGKILMEIRDGVKTVEEPQKTLPSTKIPATIPESTFKVDPEIQKFLDKIEEYREQSKDIRVGEYNEIPET